MEKFEQEKFPDRNFNIYASRNLLSQLNFDYDWIRVDAKLCQRRFHVPYPLAK